MFYGKKLKYISSVLLVSYLTMISSFSFALSGTGTLVDENNNSGSGTGTLVDENDRVTVSDIFDLADELYQKARDSEMKLENDTVYVNGNEFSTLKDAFQIRDNDVVPGNGNNTFGSDLNSDRSAEVAHNDLREATKIKDDADLTEEEAVYKIMQSNFSKIKPDLSKDPVWELSDKVLANLDEIADGIENCEISTELISSGRTYDVPKIETCEKVPVIEGAFTIYHDYSVGVIEWGSGPFNIAPCGEGCIEFWVGVKKDNEHQAGENCRHYTFKTGVRVLRPDKISFAELVYNEYDDYHRVYLNDLLIWEGLNGMVWPSTSAPYEHCERDRNWKQNANVNVTNSFKGVEPNTIVEMTTVTAVWDGGEGFSKVEVFYDTTDLIYDEDWDARIDIERALRVKQQIDDGFCAGSIECTDMPVLDSDGCTVIRGIKVCESDFKENPIEDLGISPFCRKLEVKSDCGLSGEDICWENNDGNQVCYEGDLRASDSCESYAANPECSYVESRCVDGMQGESGLCYLQTDVYDCGFTASPDADEEHEVIRCNGELQCAGDECFRDIETTQAGSAAETHAYLQIKKFAHHDMTCFNLPNESYNSESPPDEYYPIRACPEGWRFNVDDELCYKIKECNFDSENFYAASLRYDGVQLVSNSSTVYESPNDDGCKVHTVNGVAYSCGDERQRAGDEIFYEICINESQNADPLGCPGGLHEKNSNGICQVPPTPICEEGATFFEGGSKFSSSGDKCYYNCGENKCESPVDYECSEPFPLFDSAQFRCKEKSLNTTITLEQQQAQLNKENSSGYQVAYDDTENVTCQIFKGEERTCKVLGGELKLQDCCTNPQPASIGDYITLTLMVMQVDGFIAKMGWIEDYPGAWNALKSGAQIGWDAIAGTELGTAIGDSVTTVSSTVQQGIANAMSAVKGFFASPSDAVTGAGSRVLTETTVGTMLDQFKQKMLNFLYDGIKDIFGEAVAEFFIKKTGEGVGKELAGQGANYSAGTAMQAAGQLLGAISAAYTAYMAVKLITQLAFECTEDEMDLMIKKDILAVHHIGEYCKEKVPVLVSSLRCIHLVKTYCSYSSPFSRIMMEQIYMQPQMNLSWGTPENPNCQGLKFEDIEKVDFDQVNLDEWIGILMSTGNMKALQDYSFESLTGEGSIMDIDKDEVRKNSLERMNEKLEGIDVDEVRREAYNDIYEQKAH